MKGVVDSMCGAWYRDDNYSVNWEPAEEEGRSWFKIANGRIAWVAEELAGDEVSNYRIGIYAPDFSQEDGMMLLGMKDVPGSRGLENALRYADKALRAAR